MKQKQTKSTALFLSLFLALSLTLLLSLAACGEKPQPSDLSLIGNSDPSAHRPPVDASDPAIPSEGDMFDDPANSGEQHEQNDEQKREPEQIEKKYHMNKNYIIVPNDPETNKKVVLLTFDDGPKELEMIESMLDTLDKHSAKAIFFVNGYRIKAKPELLKLIAERGQIIGNHSWDHINLKEESNESIQQQIVRVQDIVMEITGERPQFFRPPHGASNDFVKQVVKEEGMLFMTWSNGSLDWDMGKIAMEDRPAAIIKNVMNQLHSGSNILMHELPWTVEALDELLTQLADKGYSFVDPRSIELEMRVGP